MPKNAETELDRLQWENDLAREQAQAAEDCRTASAGPLDRYADYEFMDEYPMIQNVLG